MVLDAREVKPGDVKFLEKLKEYKHSVVFKAEVHGTTCVMKVVSTTFLGLTFSLTTFSSAIEAPLNGIPSTEK